MVGSPPVAARLAAHLGGVTIDRVSPEGRRMAVDAITDTIGVTLAGSAEPAVVILKRTILDTGASGSATIIGDRRRVGVLDATLVNGTAAHAIDYDDMASAMGGHPSVPVIPVIFALGEILGITGRSLLDAYVVGFEAECRIGRAVHPHHYDRGWHPTSTLGVFGAAAAAARLLQLDVGKTAIALSLAAAHASGVKANFGTMTKPLHVGHCARAGLLAAMLANNGFTANPSALEHKQGFFAAYDGLDHVDIEAMFVDQEPAFEIEQTRIGLKQFPCCGSTHPAISAMLDLVGRERLASSDVVALAIRTHRRRLPHTDNPHPVTALGAKFSIQYAAARALIDGAVRLKHFEGEVYREPEMQRLLAVTTVDVFDGDLRGVEHEMAAEVTVELCDGRSLTSRFVGVLGRGPGNPMSDDEMWEKFQDCAGPVLADQRVAQAFAALRAIESAGDLKEITAMLATAGA